LIHHGADRLGPFAERHFTAQRDERHGPVFPDYRLERQNYSPLSVVA
jgi:hypothetical protein